MSNEEALKVLDATSTYVECDGCEHGLCEACELGQAQKIAKNVLKKQIPKKPENIELFIDNVLMLGICPTCENGVNSNMHYCDKCGQALNWRNVK